MADEIDLEFDNEDELTVITLEDEDGVDHEFEIIDSLEFHGHDYYALMPVSQDEVDELDGELVILRAESQDDEEDDFLSIIEDDDEYAEVVDLFMRKLSEIYGPEIITLEDTNESDEN